MLDDYQVEQKLAYKTIKNAMKKKRCSHAYIIETNGTNKAEVFSIALAKYLFCPYSYSNKEKCKECNQCQIIDDGNYLELKIIKADGMWIKKSQLDDVQKEFQNKSIIGNKKIYIIKEAEKLNVSSSNSILKFLEEPNDGIIAILIVNNIYQLLPTIVSRCQIISLKKDISPTILEILKGISKDNDQEISEKIKNCLAFIEYFEQNKLLSFTTVGASFLKEFKEKENMNLALEIITLFYSDVLNRIMGLDLVLFNEYSDIIDEISLLNTQNKICQKIKIVQNLKEKLKINMNCSLLMDKLIIELERIN